MKTQIKSEFERYDYTKSGPVMIICSDITVVNPTPVLYYLWC